MFGAATALAVAALGWTTTVVLRLEQAEIDAKGEAVYQESLRLALWRMDSWLAPRVAREAARPWFEYEPFFANDHAYTMMLQGIQPGEVLTPSPLLSYANDNFPLHFQCDGKLSLA